MNLILKALPAGLAQYARSPDFTSDTLPMKLRSAHSTKEGTWGLIRVLSGRLRYSLEAPNEESVVASEGEAVVISPGVLHRVEFVESGSFFIEFYRSERNERVPDKDVDA